MEFVEGQTLDQFIKQHGRFNVLLALDIASQVASALSAAQKEQIVHRDIKPANLMLNFPEEGAAVELFVWLWQNTERPGGERGCNSRARRSIGAGKIA
jgi:serine/threonine protein kinase